MTSTAARHVRAVHMTSVHQPDDVRIFAKQCRTLAELGYDVHLVAASASSEVVRNGVHVHGVGAPASSGRLVRMTRTVAGVLRTARALDADVYHLHDPELIPAGLVLARDGKRVVYDAHEDLPADILDKAWIRRRLRTPVSRLAELLERFAAERFAAVVTATPSIHDRFSRYRCRTVVVSNYPALAEFDVVARPAGGKDRAVCFVGGISEIRGAGVMVGAMADIDATLLLAGRFLPPQLRDQLAGSAGWSRVVELGQIGRSEVMTTLGRSMAGLVLYAPVANHWAAQPTKVYEYMAAGLPVIASDFPRWRAIVEAHECGLCVDPTDPVAVRRAIVWVLDHPAEAQAMGRNGRRAVERHFSWESERGKLERLYQEILH
jgi:glycosyltransferase involved in cell wall biosynthesis